MTTVDEQKSDTLVVGKIAGLYGVRGWVKVYSHTQPKENILDYQPWLLMVDGKLVEQQLDGGRLHGKGIVVKLKGCEDRDMAASYIGADIRVRIDQLPTPESGAYYWRDLTGLLVINTQGEHLGVVDHLLETGANDVLVVMAGERQRLIPFVMDDVVIDVDLDNRRMTVVWDADF